MRDIFPHNPYNTFLDFAQLPQVTRKIINLDWHINVNRHDATNIFRGQTILFKISETVKYNRLSQYHRIGNRGPVTDENKFTHMHQLHGLAIVGQPVPEAGCAVPRRTERMGIPTTRFKQTASDTEKYHNRLVNTTTHCRTSTAGNSCSTTYAALSTVRLILNDAYTPQPKCPTRHFYNH